MNASTVNKYSKKTVIIGIDPGVKTGLSVWLRHGKKFTLITTCGILKAHEWVLRTCGLWDKENVLVRIENPNLRTWFGNSGREVLQGAGSIKRDYSVWVEFLTDNGIDYEDVAPKHNKTKLKADTFKQITGWTEATNEHGRDSAMLCFQF